MSGLFRLIGVGRNKVVSRLHEFTQAFPKIDWEVKDLGTEETLPVQCSTQPGRPQADRRGVVSLRV